MIYLSSRLNDLQIQENDLYSISIEDKLNVAIVGHPDSIEILKEDYIVSDLSRLFLLYKGFQL